jgi:ketosteroid isomerase-like protein
MNDNEQNLTEAARAGFLPQEGTVLQGDEWIGLTEVALTQWAAPDFVTVMHSQAAVQEHEGVAGFREAMTDWISPYETFRVAIDRVLTDADRLVFLVRQLARTKHQNVEIETPSASVWWTKDGRVTQVVFYLDQAAALKAAGIGPDRLSSG